VFLRDYLAGHRLKFSAEFAAPGAEFEGLVLPRRALDRRDVFPGFVIARTVTVVHGIEHSKLGLTRSVQNLQHMRDAAICFSNGLDAGPDLAAFRDEVVIRIDN